jgi:transcriptional regulator with PAS, ATPase and Fis domain
MTRRNQETKPDKKPFARPRSARSKVLSDRVERLAAITLDLTMEIESLLSCDTVIRLPSFDKKIDFYREVRNFEIFLIKRALKQTAGSQVQASNLLRLDSTTLNKKIKSYEIS